MPVRYLQNSSVHVNSHHITSLFWIKEIVFLLHFNGSIWTAGGLVFRTSKPMDGLISNVVDSFIVGIPGQNTFWSNIVKPALCPAQRLCAVTFLLVTLTHWGGDKMAAIFHTTFSNAFSWMKTYINFDYDFIDFFPKCPIINILAKGSDNGLALARRQDIVRTNDG